ncbi:hypothetical protein D3C84_553920 [compost metagenome]
MATGVRVQSPSMKARAQGALSGRGVPGMVPVSAVVVRLSCWVQRSSSGSLKSSPSNPGPIQPDPLMAITALV